MGQEQFAAMMPYISADLVAMIAEKQNISHEEAIKKLYASQLYAALEKEETKLWYASPAQIVAEYLTPPKRKNKSYQNGPGRSKLAPYAEQIKTWKNKGMTLREIAAELQKYGCSTTAQNLSLFLSKK